MQEMKENKDYLVRATAADGKIRAFAATTRDMAETARRAHDTSPVVTAALGRLLTGGAMMGAGLKGDRDLLTLRVMGDGPIGALTVTADANGRVKGFANHPQVMLPPNALKKLDVGGGVGNGVLQVTKDLGLKEPYVGSVELQTGEIAEDLTYYFTVSEQTPSTVGLGVLMEKDNTVKQSGGFLIQLMPEATEETIAALEENLKNVDSVTGMLEEGLSPEGILKRLLQGLSVQFLDTMPVAFVCNCSKERFRKGLASLPKKDIRDMVEDGESIEIKCNFCNTAYIFSVEELKQLEETQRA